RGLYRLLSEPDPSLPRIPWHGVHLFWGDERHVPPDHPESNYRMVRETLLDEIDIPAGHVHRIPAERADAGAAADEYEDELRGFFGLRTGVLPRFDLVLLGLGRDGHTASLFPGSEALRESRRAVVATRAEGPLPRRISLTMPAINNAARVVFLVSGADKAEALRRVVRGRATIDSPPARWVRPAGGALWIVDRAAARLLAG
ncbi:MAG: 6-phosphogluconolactonase, partial [Acidobacteriota bacterium]